MEPWKRGPAEAIATLARQNARAALEHRAGLAETRRDETPRMTTLSFLAGFVPAAFLAGAWSYLRTWRNQRQPECGRAPRTVDAGWPEIPGETWEPEPLWCPAHELLYGPETECPGCREEWEQTWTLGEEPEAIAARDLWEDARAEAAGQGEGNGWFLDLIRVAEMGGDQNQ